MDIITQIRQQKLNEKVTDVDKLHTDTIEFDKKISTDIKKINNLSDEADASGFSTSKINNIKDKLNIIQSQINVIVKAHTLNEIIPPDGIVDIIDKIHTDELRSLSLIYYGFISKHNGLKRKFELQGKKMIEFIDNETNKSIIELFSEIEKFKKLVTSKINLATAKLKANSDEYVDDLRSQHIKLTTNEKIYSYAKRIVKSDLSTTIVSEKFSSLNELINLSTNLTNKTDYTEVHTSVADVIDFDSVYSGVMIRSDSMIGGSELEDNFYKLTKIVHDLNKLMRQYINSLISQKLFEIQRNNYFMYLILASTPRSNENTIVYNYMNKGLIQFYLSIIEGILEHIKSGSKRKDIVYFLQNHYVMLNKLQTFLRFMVVNIKTLDVVDINKCSGDVKKNFFLLNFFKDILDSYHEILQSKVSVYARINDWGNSNGISKDASVFVVHENDARSMVVIRKNCKGNHASPSVVKFTEVFDTENFNTNANITKYMTLETQLSKKKGVMLMTYGYSGTGKTFTLFGSHKAIDGTIQGTVEIDKKQGLLQATLGNITGLTEVKFRVFELYGRGVQYPHYWTDKRHIDQRVVKYGLAVEDEKLKITSHGDISNVLNFVRNRAKNCVTINEKDIEKVFGTFGAFTGELDKIRKSEGRIKITPNNPESSRSVVIYEFLLFIEGSYVPFVIIDLPGREEIVETYCDNYLSKPFAKQFNTKFHKALLTSMSTNPLALAILVPSIIFETFNSKFLQLHDRKKIMSTPLLTDVPNGPNIIDEDDEDEEADTDGTDGTGEEDVDYIENSSYTGDMKDGSIFEKEYFTTTTKLNGTKIQKNLSYIYNFDDQLWKNQYIFKMIRSGSTSKVAIRTSPAPKHVRQINVKKNSIQYEGALAIHLMNRLITMRRFDIIDEIYKNVIDEHFNMDAFAGTIRDKRQFLLDNADYFDSNTILSAGIDEINDMFDQFVYFRNTMSPFEGIFINETIVGLIKVLAHNILGKDDAYIKDKLMKEQNKTLDFTTQKNAIRESNVKLYSETKNDSSELYENSRYNNEKESRVELVNVYRNNDELDKIIQNNRTLYSSQNIYNYNIPSIESIINIYLIKNTSENVEAVTDFKLFYLFTNTQQDKKCTHQIKLLDNTMSFIDTTTAN